MKRMLLFLSVVLFIVFFWWVFSEKEKEFKNYPSHGANIIAFGDSLVYGSGATEGSDFVSILSQDLNISIINKGIPGDTTELALLRLKRDVLSRNPKVVMVLIGGNDFLKRVPKDKMLNNLREIIQNIQNEGAVVLLLGVRGGLFTDTFENDLEKLAMETQSAYVPNVLNGLLGNSKFMDDAIHPNDEGHKIIASRVLKVLKGLIN